MTRAEEERMLRHMSRRQREQECMEFKHAEKLQNNKNKIVHGGPAPAPENNSEEGRIFQD